MINLIKIQPIINNLYILLTSKIKINKCSPTNYIEVTYQKVCPFGVGSLNKGQFHPAFGIEYLTLKLRIF